MKKEIDVNEIDNALFEIQQMIRVAHHSVESLGGVGDSDVFQMPADDANLLEFALFDISRRVDELKASL